MILVMKEREQRSLWLCLFWSMFWCRYVVKATQCKARENRGPFISSALGRSRALRKVSIKVSKQSFMEFKSCRCACATVCVIRWHRLRYLWSMLSNLSNQSSTVLLDVFVRIWKDTCVWLMHSTPKKTEEMQTKIVKVRENSRDFHKKLFGYSLVAN